MSRNLRRLLKSLSVLILAASTVTLAAPEPSKRFKATALEPASQTISRSKPQRGTGMASVIVKFDADSVALKAGASVQAGALRRLDLKSAAAKDQLSLLADKRRTFEAAAARALPSARIVHDLNVVLGGVSMVVPENQVEALRRLPGVRQVYRDELLQIDTERSPRFIGAHRLWQNGPAGRGAGVVVGVLDTGIWPEHPSYSDPDPNGSAYPAPPPPLSGTRACEFSGGANPGPAFTCNNKLIGADRFMATYDAVIGLLPAEFTTARDDNGHGTHTSSTAAGNNNVAASIFSVPRGQVSGVAPRAHVIMYKVCGDQGCFQSDSVAAVQKAIQDGVDVINFSISGGGNPYADAVSLAFLDAYNAGIFVAASAGNAGPAADTTDHREPWTTTVAASTTDRHFISTLTLMDGADTLVLSGASVTAGVNAFTPLVNAADPPYSDTFCTTPAAAGTFTGKVVICQRGVNARVEKSFNVVQGGAVGMILYNPTLQGLATDNHFLPSVHLENDAGAALLAFHTAHPGATAMFTQGVATPVQGDVMAAFSSRGGPGQTLGISKPDVTAPGVQILAGNSPMPATVVSGQPGELFQAIQGTSMSSPHAAGAAAQLIGLHPTWTPGQVKSALMLTGQTTRVFKEDGTTPSDPFDRGSGRIRPDNADNPGISISDTGANFIAHQANLSVANYPSLYVPIHPGIVTVHRTVHSELWTSATWKITTSAPSDVKISVTPKRFTLAAGGNLTIAITVDAKAVPVGQTRFARLRFTSGSHVADFPVSLVRRDTPLTFAKSCTPLIFTIGTNTDCEITLTNTGFDDANVALTDELPQQLRLLSVNGATFVDSRHLTFDGVLQGAEPPNVAIASGALFGYIPLSGFGVPPTPFGDDQIINFNVPAFTYAGETWTSLGISSNGYIVVGGGTGPDNSLNNQDFPNPTRPNNVLAAFWTDLNPAAAGAIRIALLSDGLDDWIVVDWAGVREFSTAGNLHSFEIWIGINGDANPGEDITYAYGANIGNGDGGFLSVGAENRFGNRGDNTYFNGAGTLPTVGADLRVTSAPGAPGETKVITFIARGHKTGNWTNCAQAVSAELFFGTATACTSGMVTN